MPARVARFSTHGLNEEQRSARWEDWNRGALVGLNCHTPGGRGLRGEEVTLDLGDLTLGHVQAERHHISRTSATVDDSPTRSMVVYAILRGATTFSDSAGSWALTPGDAAVIDADRPFRRTFPTGFAELAIKLPLQPQARQGPQDRQAREAGQACQARTGTDGAHVVRTSGLAAVRVRTLGRHVARWCLPSGPGDLDTVRQVALDLVDDLTIGAGVGDRHALARLLIEQNLADPRLSAAALAGALEISERQLSRMFAATRTTLPRYVTERRLARAAALLATPAALPISGIAARCGFSSAAYFSRVFHDHYDMSAQQFRLQLRENGQSSAPA